MAHSPNKLEVIANRDKLRDSIRVCVVSPLVQFKPSSPLVKPFHEKKPEPSANSLNSSRKRKRSEDLSVFENPSKVKEVYITENFFSLFELGPKLGEGAQSLVRKCTEIASQKVFAVKLFRTSDSELIHNLKSQYKILKSLVHPNIITANYLFIDEKANNTQLVLQFCDYPHLPTGSPYTEQQASEVVGQLLQAVSYIHERGICHRDIKPQNLLYDPVYKIVKLIDFEIAKNYRNRLERLEMWTPTGTLYYKAPEMFAGKYTELIDVWAVGVLTYELLTGKLPFGKEYVENTIQDIKKNEPQYPEHLSKFSRDFIKKCLTKNPLQRPTAKEMCSHPFLLQFDSKSSLGSPINPDKLNRSFDSKLNDWSSVMEQQEDQLCGFKLNKITMDDTHESEYNCEDIGIRCCTTEMGE